MKPEIDPFAMRSAARVTQCGRCRTAKRLILASALLFAGAVQASPQPAPPAPLDTPAGESTGRPSAGTVFRDRLRSGAKGPELVVVPPGVFGQGEIVEAGMRPLFGLPYRSVSIGAFAVGKHEVTRGEFRRFVGATGYLTDAERNVQIGGQDVATPGCPTLYPESGVHWRDGTNWQAPGFPQDDTHPVACVSWNDAKAYVDWLSEQTGQQYRLPSESELEYVIRAGSTTLWPWGNWGYSACDRVNYADERAAHRFPNLGLHDCDDGHVFTAPVGSYPANALGLHDTAGNVQEWAEDCWQHTSEGAPSDGSAWIDQPCGWRVIRGGAWSSPPNQVRSSARNGNAPEWRDGWTGFRVVRTL